MARRRSSTIRATLVRAPPRCPIPHPSAQTSRSSPHPPSPHPFAFVHPARRHPLAGWLHFQYSTDCYAANPTYGNMPTYACNNNWGNIGCNSCVGDFSQIGYARWDAHCYMRVFPPPPPVPPQQPPAPPSIPALWSDITCTAGGWASEVSWQLSCDDGTSISGGAPYDSESPVAVQLGSTCNLAMSDSFGDGWNGAEWGAPGFGVEGLSMTTGYSAEESFVIGGASS